MTITPLHNLFERAGLEVADRAKESKLRSPSRLKRAARNLSTEGMSAHAARRAARSAMRNVPAYREFLEDSNWVDERHLSATEWLATLPVTDLQNYIYEFTTEERCAGGRIPLHGAEMDHPSRWTGDPNNWVRSYEELEDVHGVLSSVAEASFDEDIVTVNCFPMGAWSTGTNSAAVFRRSVMLKSPGPDVAKVIETLRSVGPLQTFVIAGHAPFLQELLDHGDSIGFDWNAFRMFGVSGASISEQLRARLERRFKKVYCAYGVGDLDIGIASETPTTIRLRQTATRNEELRRDLFGGYSELPMLFQYNPLDYFIETNTRNELIVTVNRLTMLSPRIRYNAHQLGEVATYEHVVSIAREYGVELEVPGETLFTLPFILVAESGVHA